MVLIRIWDYWMRRKPLLVAVLVAIFGGFCICRTLFAELPAQQNIAVPLTLANPLENSLELQVLGKNQSPALQINFGNNFQLATVTLQSELLSSESYLRILGADGALLVGEYTTVYDQGSDLNYYFADAPKSYQLSLTPGMVIEIRAAETHFYSTLDHALVTAYAPRDEVEAYVVTANGLRRSDWVDEYMNQVMYQVLLDFTRSQIMAYQTTITNQILDNRKLDFERKAEIIELYNQLRAEDQTEFVDFIEHLRRGGSPTILYRGATSYYVGELADIRDFIDIKDNEDGNISNDHLMIDGNLDPETPGNYAVKLSVYDSDNNLGELELELTILAAADPTPDPIPNENRPAQTPVETNGASESPVTSDAIWNEQSARTDYSLGEEEVPSLVAEVTMADQERQPNWVASSDLVSIPQTAQPEQTESNHQSRPIQLIAIIIAGSVALLGFVKFIFDHFVR